MATRRRTIMLLACTGGVLCAWANGCGFDGVGSESIATGDAAVAETSAVLPDGAPTPDSAVTPDATTEAGPPPPATVVLASAGSVAAPTGNAQQTHLVYAVHSQRWWLFTIDSTDVNALRTYSSADFTTWVAGASLVLPLPHPNDGRGFSVAYADVGGTDVVHIAFSGRNSATDRRHLHARATISAGAIAFGTPQEIVAIADTAAVDPDGCATVIAADGHVMDFTGWAPYGGSSTQTGNHCGYLASNIDTGATWTTGFGARTDIAIANKTINARVALPTTGSQLVTLWETADVEPAPANVGWAQWNGSAWSIAGNVFAVGQSLGYNDWAVTRLSSGEIHAVRRTSLGAYEHRKLVTSTWTDGQPIAAQPGAANGGLVLLSLGTHMLLATIGADAATSVNVTTWDGATWGAWSAIESTALVRTFPSGHASAAGGAALVWTEQVAGGAMQVAGRRVLF